MAKAQSNDNIIPILDTRLRLVEAILFASAKPVSEAELRQRLPEGTEIGAILAALQRHYGGRGVVLMEIAGGWQFRTAVDLASVMTQLVAVPRKLSRVAVETLSIIAYQQPITRGEIEEIRGVVISKGTLDQLLEAGWIKPAGKRDSPGRPTQWATTKEFLIHFGLAEIGDLPNIEELRAAGLLERRPGLSILAMSEEEAEQSQQLPLDHEPTDED